ncbi:MAG: hypothetical protein RLZZ618_553 [Pseudomonadota bacterium]|jgi:outer membrane murein-binding lipoprotein Lpp
MMIKRSVLKLAAAAACAMILAGCATGVKYQDMAATIPAVKADAARVYFFRSASMVGAAIQPEIRLDGKPVGESKPGGFFFVDTAPGTHLAASSTETEKSLSFSLAAGETKYVRSSIGLGLLVGRVVLDLEPADKAKAELPSLAFTGTNPAPATAK